MHSAAVVDMVRVRLESEPFKALKNYIENRYSESSQHFFNSENELRQEHKQLRDREKIADKPDEALLKQRQDFDRKVAELEHLVQQKKEALNEQFNTLSAQLEEKLTAIIAELADDLNVPIVFNKTLGPEAAIVLFQKTDLDITDLVIQRLNSAMPELSLPND